MGAKPAAAAHATAGAGRDAARQALAGAKPAAASRSTAEAGRDAARQTLAGVEPAAASRSTQQADDGLRAVPRMDVKPAAASHATSIAVWGVPSPVAADGRFTVRVGVKCAAGCPLTGQPVAVRNEAGTGVGRGRLGAAPEPGTRALYRTDLTLTAPAREGVHAWTVVFAAAGTDPAPAHGAPPAAEATARKSEATARESTAHGTPPAAEATARESTAHGTPPASEATARESAPAHEASTATFGFRTVRPPEHRVTVTVCDRDTGTPLAGAEVRVGVHRGTTDADGKALVEAPAGRHEVYVRKAGYLPLTGGVTVRGDIALRFAAARVSDADPDEEQVWM